MSYGSTIVDLRPGKPLYRIVVPRKLALGKSIQGTQQPGLFRVYVPTKDGGQLTIKTSAGTVEIYGPDGKPAVDRITKQPVAAGSEVKFETDKHGWYGVLVKGSSSYKVNADFVIKGEAKEADGSVLIPFNFYYFPFTDVVNEGEWHSSAKYDKLCGTKANQWEKADYWKTEIETGQWWQSGNDGHGITESACAKYNEYLKNKGSTYRVKVEDCGWWGHCDASSVSSAVFAKPTSGDPLDVRWAMTELAMRGYDTEQLFHLGKGLPGYDPNSARNNESNKSMPKPEGGQALDRDITRLHNALIACIKQGHPALMDLRANYDEGSDNSGQVWNQAAYRFEAVCVQAEDDTAGGDELDKALTLKIVNTIRANADRVEEARANTDPETGSAWIRVLEYKLQYNKFGDVELDGPKNNFTSSKNDRGTPFYPPRYICKIKGIVWSAVAERNGYRQGKGNAEVTIGDVKSKLGAKVRSKFQAQ